MKAIMIMFDSLNRRFLPPYGCEWIHAPNFERLAKCTVTFDGCFIGSMPCMPARRELHTGRYNFLHRSWGPLEPFDRSMPDLLGQNGIYTHLVSDHQHYWEDGGATYHTRYTSWECVRGQEGDPWFGQVETPELPANTSSAPAPIWRQDVINRGQVRSEVDMPQAQVFQRGLDFIRRNARADQWFLQIENFDPHEPFFTLPEYKDLYPHTYHGPHFDWPPYDHITQTPGEVEHVRYEYAALLSMCDRYLGQVLDLMDEMNLWQDTMLIVNTDHGYLLGEHDWWAKSIQPYFNEVANIPLFIWDPRSAVKNERRACLAQTIDLPATLLDYFHVPCPEEMLGVSLADAVANGIGTRPAVLFGMFGGHVNVTDGRYVYMRAPVRSNNTPLNEYTLIPSHMRKPFSIDELRSIELRGPFSFTRGVPVMKIPGRGGAEQNGFGTQLYDLKNDPAQEHPLTDPEIEKVMLGHLIRLMKANDAPPEQYERLGLEPPA